MIYLEITSWLFDKNELNLGNKQILNLGGNPVILFGEPKNLLTAPQTISIDMILIKKIPWIFFHLYFRVSFDLNKSNQTGNLIFFNLIQFKITSNAVWRRCTGKYL